MEHLDGAPDLLEATRVHHGDPVGDLERVLAIVGHEDRRHARLGVQAAKPRPQLLTHPRVERPERLVEQEHARLRGQRPREGDALPLATGELRRRALREPFEPHVAEELAHAARRRAPVDAPRTRSPKATFSKTVMCSKSA